MTNVILVGNPNTGKTTLFNTLTKSNSHVGNWHGVTVQVEKKKFSYKGVKYTLCDLPGIYALKNYSQEEQVANQFLVENSNSLVINICDANNLSRNLLLTLQLLEKGYKVILAVNMANEVDNINYDALSKMLGIKVVPIDARKRKYANLLIEQVQQSAQNVSKRPSYIPKLTQDEEYNNAIRYNYIDVILNNCTTAKTKENYGISKLDKIFFNKYLALPIFLIVMLLVFTITFGKIGNNFSLIVNNIYNLFADTLNTALCKLSISAWAHALIMQGIVGGIGVIVGFLPQVTLLFLCMNFLEDVGYLSRVAVMFDGYLNKIGLTGKSVFSILLGFGCTTTALLTTRALDNINLRKRTALIVPFASCSAKLPVYALICSAFFTKHKALMVFLMYVLGIAVGLGVSAIASKVSKKKDNTFIMELPPLRVPTIKKTIKNLFTNVNNFIKRVGGTLIICSVIVWILSNISFSFKYVTNVKDSILYTIANFIYPIFKPLGFSSPLIVVALIVGIIAKEMVVSCLAISNGVVGNLSVLATSLTLSTSVVHFTPASAVSFLVFILLYSPCISAISVTAKEIGAKFALFVFVFQFMLAYSCSFVAYFLSSLLCTGKILEFFIVIIVLALIIFAVLKCIHKKRKCKTCKGIYCGKTCMQK